VYVVVREDRVSAAHKSRKWSGDEDAHLIALLEALPISASMASTSDMVVRYANEAWLRLLGFSASDEVVGRTVESFVAPECLEKARSALAHGKKTGSYAHRDRRYQLIRADGTLVDVEIAGAPAMLGGSPAVVSLVTDVSDEEQARRSLEESERGYRTLIENAADAMIVHRDESILYANPAGLALYGATRAEEVVGRPIWDFIAPDSRPMSIERVREITSESTTLPRVRVDLVDIQGRSHAAEAHDVRIPYGGGTAILTTLRDLGPAEDAEKALDESRRLLQRILDTTTNLVYIYDLVEHRNVYANRELTQYLGYTPEQVRALGSGLFARILHPDDATLVAKHHALCAAAADGETLEVEYRMQHADGCWRWLYSRDVPFARDESGAATQILGVCSDITERKLAEEALLAAHALQAQIFETMPDGFSILDSEGVHISVNPAMCQMTGFAEDELVGVGPPHPYWPPEEYEVIGRALGQTVRGEISEAELTFMRKNGERFPVIVVPSIVRDAGGDMVRAYASVRDITTRKQAERELRESEERYRSVVSSLHEGVILQAADGTILAFNRTASDIFGIGHEEAVGQTSTSRDWGTIREDGTEFPGSEHPSMHTLRTGEPCTDVVVGVRGPLGLRWVEVSTEPMMREGEALPYAVVVSFTDITERRRVDEELRTSRDDLERIVEERTRELTETNRALLEASNAKSQFLASMSHELRTPLNSIIGFTGIMLQGMTGDLTTEQRAQLEMVNRAGRQLLGLVSDVLDLERVEAGRVSLELEDVDIGRLAHGLADTVRPMAEDVGLKLELDLERAPVEVRTDRAKLEQILLNFLSNAVKYTEAGTITLRVESREDGSVAASVSDTGVGIAEEDHARVFEEFRQLPATRGAKRPGSGLGLAISWQLAQVLGGRIELVSEPDAGSTFTLILPARSPSADGPGGH
jgi:two-component system sensor histidine kinase/response regulator